MIFLSMMKIKVGVFTFYIKEPTMHYKDLEKAMINEVSPYCGASYLTRKDSVEHQIETLIRKISAPLEEENLIAYLEELKRSLP